ncbi:cytochrome P450 [Mycena latifolia]|nr:cytochrome P450 [Mycena latifolia]
MVVHPDVQTQAQQELDLLLNNSRLPTMEIRPSLPYLNAVIKETLRWHVTLPLAIARHADKDDIYKGNLIPKGSIILPNVCGIAGEGDYLTGFSPERYLSGDSFVDPDTYAFGFGRRACPGQYLAENFMFIFAASILATFRITNQVDSAGNKIPVVPKLSPGLIRREHHNICSPAVAFFC